VSFEVMRERGIGEAFAFDPEFAREGFTTLPA
jgi:predicted nucleic acid-binding protein